MIATDSLLDEAKSFYEEVFIRSPNERGIKSSELSLIFLNRSELLIEQKQRHDLLAYAWQTTMNAPYLNLIHFAGNEIFLVLSQFIQDFCST